MPLPLPHTGLRVVLLPLLAAASVACSGDGQARGARPQGDRVMPVAASPVARRDLFRDVTVAAPVEAVRTIGVNSLMAGTVTALHVREGDRVREGQLLAELDARETMAQLERARAILAGAEAAYRRSEQLFESRSITATEFDQARSAYDVASSDAELWRTRLAFSRITAPVAGLVTVKHVEAGTGVSPNQRLVDLADVSVLVMRVQLSELDVVQLRAGGSVQVSLDAYPGVTARGRIRRVFPSADPQSRLVPVEVELGPMPGGVTPRPGYLTRVTFALDRRSGALAVPAPAVGVGGEGPFVYVVQTDSVVRRPVDVGLSVEGWVEIVAGLGEGELVVTSGHTNLRPGARVRVVDASRGPEAGE